MTWGHDHAFRLLSTTSRLATSPQSLTSTLEAIFTIQSLISQSPEIQKIMAFEGAFEKFFNIVVKEQGVEGGVVVQDALTCIDGLLRFNQSNQVRIAVMSYICTLPDHRCAV